MCWQARGVGGGRGGGRPHLGRGGGQEEGGGAWKLLDTRRVQIVL